MEITEQLVFILFGLKNPQQKISAIKALRNIHAAIGYGPVPGLRPCKEAVDALAAGTGSVRIDMRFCDASLRPLLRHYITSHFTEVSPHRGDMMVIGG